MTEQEIIDRLRRAILESVPDGVVGHRHADIYARAALHEFREIERLGTP